jgi:hypothetical protein
VPDSARSGGGSARARRRLRVWLVPVLGGILAGLTTAGAAAAQAQPAPPEPADTILVPIPPEQVGGDTIPAVLREEAAAPTPARLPPRLPPPGVAGWSAARWEWSRVDLERLPGLTVLEFLELLPGFAGFRAGGFGRPVGLTALGMGGARIRVLLDGYELDPLRTAAYELESIPLLDVHTLRVTRSVAEVVVEVEGFRLEEPEPFSVVELGTGVFQTRVLRALFSRGFGQRSVATGTFDLATTGGIGIREQYSHSTAQLRWDFAPGEATGLRAEIRRTAFDRRGTLYPLGASRSEFIVRARQELVEGLTLEALVGRSMIDEGEDEAGVALPRPRSLQGAVRANLTGTRFSAEAAFRARRTDELALPLPGAEGELRASFAPAPQLLLEVASRAATAAGANAAHTRVVGTLAPGGGLALFGEITLGSRLLPFAPTVPVLDAPREMIVGGGDGWRAGAELVRDVGSLGGAFFTSGAGPVVPFGLLFDRAAPPVDAPALGGAEAYLRLPIPRTARALQLEGSFTRFLDALDRPYTPQEIGRLALSFRRVFYDGQLEPVLHLQAIHRGAARVPTAAPPIGFTTFAQAHQRVDLALRIRILDVTAFLDWENLLADQTARQLPWAPPTYPRIVYGARWEFRN